MAEPRPLRLVVVDDSEDFRATLVDLLAELPAVEVVGQGESGEQATRLVRAHRADVAILDLRMPVTGLAAIAALKRARPVTKIVVLTASGEEHQQEVQRAGADAFVRKTGGARLLDDIADALARVTGRSDLGRQA